MRLINTQTLELEFFYDEEKPPYGILSHTWLSDKDEVTFQEFNDLALRPYLTGRPGFLKIEKTCELARVKYGLDYAWVDTCCIDKTSSAELSEAINSMYNWYGKAEICIAYLADLDSAGKLEVGYDDVKDCRWFTRGYTLQELIAPGVVDFYDRQWVQVGCKKDETFASLISRICSVDLDVLMRRGEISEVSVASRMSWAATRTTKRPEDRAYCLLGIFNVNMPLLYGEGGEKAFIRLQEEIMRSSTDTSIFAWSPKTLVQRGNDSGVSHEHYVGMLATSPALFQGIGMLVTAELTTHSKIEYSMTNRGIKLLAPLVFHPESGHFSMLPSHWDISKEEMLHPIFLRQTGSDSFVRTWPTEAMLDRCEIDMFQEGPLQELYVANLVSPKEALKLQSLALQLELEPPAEFGDCIIKPIGSYDPSQQLLIPNFNGVFEGILEFNPPWAGEFDSFVVIATCDASDNHNWEFRILTGDDWISHKEGHRYRHASGGIRTSYRRSTLPLSHLYEEGTEKTLIAEARRDTDLGRTVLMLNII